MSNTEAGDPGSSFRAMPVDEGDVLIVNCNRPSGSKDAGWVPAAEAGLARQRLQAATGLLEQMAVLGEQARLLLGDA